MRSWLIVNNGTTGTTRWRCDPARSSPTSATSTPTGVLRTPACGCTPSRGSSYRGAAVAHGACPVRSCATPYPCERAGRASDVLLERLHCGHLDGEVPGRSLIAHRVADPRADQGSAERRVGADHRQAGGAILAAADEERLLVAVLVDGGHDVAGADDVASGRRADLRAPQHVLELADARLHLALLVLGRVILGVLAQIAVCPRGFDRCGCLLATRGFEMVEFRLQTIVGRLGQPDRVIQCEPPRASVGTCRARKCRRGWGVPRPQQGEMRARVARDPRACAPLGGAAGRCRAAAGWGTVVSPA